MVSEKKKEALDKLKRSFMKFGELPSDISKSREKSKEEKKNAPRSHKIIDFVHAIITIGITFYLRSEHLWPSTVFTKLKYGEKWSFLLCGLTIGAILLPLSWLLKKKAFPKPPNP
jgi:hypothetical protein